MRGYAETPICHRQHLLGSFGEQLDTQCGQCDVYAREDEHHATGAGHRDAAPPPGRGS
ncbi:RecQ family zinc-binding domain-containing protein [Streptomyces sp. NPDC046859]|uniref:RecQ family zinc-binding domain-containing protein n=1 Tax=Streptomyces sp. NPDC046859 TaxID=3155734 RepID=UPI00340A51E3